MAVSCELVGFDKQELDRKRKVEHIKLYLAVILMPLKMVGGGVCSRYIPKSPFIVERSSS